MVSISHRQKCIECSFDLLFYVGVFKRRKWKFRSILHFVSAEWPWQSSVCGSTFCNNLCSARPEPACFGMGCFLGLVLSLLIVYVLFAELFVELCVHPTWFICNEAFKVNVFHEI